MRFVIRVLMLSDLSIAPHSFTNTASDCSECRSICWVAHPTQCPYLAWACCEAQKPLVTELNGVSLPKVVAVVAAAVHVDEKCDFVVWRWRNAFAAKDYVDVFLHSPRCEKEESSIDFSRIR